MEKETKTIRVSKESLEILSKYGNFGDNWNSCILNMHNKLKSQKEKNKQK